MTLGGAPAWGSPAGCLLLHNKVTSLLLQLASGIHGAQNPFAAQVNLVATQLVLDREHPNRLVFSPARGLDPLLDLRLRGAEVGCCSLLTVADHLAYMIASCMFNL